MARYSARDAEQLTAMIGEWRDGLAARHGRWNSALELPDDDVTRRYHALRQRSAWDVVHERFTHPVVRAFVLWLAMATITDPRRPGTGFLPSSLTAGRLDFGWTTPVGGSQALPDALGRLISAHGGQVACSSSVSVIEVSGGRASAVGTADGRRVEARRAVVSSVHLTQLEGMLENAPSTPDLAEARGTWQPGLSVFAVHAALRDGPVAVGRRPDGGRPGPGSGRRRDLQDPHDRPTRAQ